MRWHRRRPPTKLRGTEARWSPGPVAAPVGVRVGGTPLGGGSVRSGEEYGRLTAFGQSLRTGVIPLTMRRTVTHAVRTRGATHRPVSRMLSAATGDGSAEWSPFRAPTLGLLHRVLLVPGHARLRAGGTAPQKRTWQIPRPASCPPVRIDSIGGRVCASIGAVGHSRRPPAFTGGRPGGAETPYGYVQFPASRSLYLFRARTGSVSPFPVFVCCPFRAPDRAVPGGRVRLPSHGFGHGRESTGNQPGIGRHTGRTVGRRNVPERPRTWESTGHALTPPARHGLSVSRCSVTARPPGPPVTSAAASWTRAPGNRR
ncbi:hypothetical protein SUDANB19_03573 [Streptomyces sp. enrichment culture]